MFTVILEYLILPRVQVLYIPCMVSLWHNRANNASYKLLFYIGVVDMGILWVLGFLHGWLSLEGAVYCTYPSMLYLIGCFQQGKKF